MSIRVLKGLPGSGKSSRLIAEVRAAQEQGRPAVTFISAESPWLMAQSCLRADRILGCRLPDLTCPVDHLVTTAHARELLDRLEPGTLAAFDEAFGFSSEIVPSWIAAAERGVDLIIATPSDEQAEMLTRDVAEQIELPITCERCGKATATTFVILPGADSTAAVCASCDRAWADEVRVELLDRLLRQGPYPSEKALYQPVEFAECADWRVLRPDSEARAQLMSEIVQAVGLPAPDGRNTYLDVGCNTGYFCSEMGKLGFCTTGVDVVEPDIAVARLLDSHFRRQATRFLVQDAHAYLTATRDERFDVTSAFSVFQWLMLQTTVERGIECIHRLFDKTRAVCFLEMGYGTEEQYAGKLPRELDAAWVLEQMRTAGGFAHVRALDAKRYGLMRDLFVGYKNPVANGAHVPFVSIDLSSKRTAAFTGHGSGLDDDAGATVAQQDEEPAVTGPAVDAAAMSPAAASEWTSLTESLQRYAADPGNDEQLVHAISAALDATGAGGLKRLFDGFQARGYHLTPVHFYEPIPDTRTLGGHIWSRESALAGVDMNEPGQLTLLREGFAAYLEECKAIPSTPSDEHARFHLNNGRFDGTDALVLYCMIRHFRPRTVLEVGSGMSSRLSAEAALRNGDTSLICIEPFPAPFLRDGFPGLTRLIEAPVQRVRLAEFEQLEANDVLFIDSSHVARIGSDVNYLFLEVLPRLKPGVIVHVHDIFLPQDYRRDWVMTEHRFWNEQYLLQAFLVFNAQFEVLFANSYMGAKHRAELKAAFPTSPWWGGGSFWMRRRR